VPLFEAVRLALITIRTQKLKSAFTLLGVCIGVMFLISVVSIVEGMGRYMEEDLIGKLIAVRTFELRHRPNIQMGDVDP
jgi:putative ABC transport system permease protein